MSQSKVGVYAASVIGLLLAREAWSMDVHTVKGKDGKDYFCANAKCSGQSSCMGAGNSNCGSQNKCANTKQKYLSGWFYADDKEACEKGPGKWMLFKKEFGINDGNKPPFGMAKKPEAVKK